MTPFSTPWLARGVPARTLCRTLLILFAFITPVVLFEIERLGLKDDFFAFHSYAMFVRLHPPGLIYDYTMLRRFQGLTPPFFPYFYQPQMLLLVWPLAHLPYLTGYVLWMLVGMFACTAVIGFLERNPAALAAVFIGPSTLLVWLNGQSSMIAAALMFGGFGMLRRRPVLAGVLFGLMIYKPQLAVLVPVALLAARQWRTIASAAATAILFVVASAVVFGTGVWVSWWRHLPEIGATIASKTLELRFLMATVTSNLLALGATPGQAHVVQALLSVGTAIVVWRCFRDGVCMLGAALVGVGTFLATPFAFGYDLAVFNLGVIVVASERWRQRGSFNFLEIVILVLGFLLPWCVISPVMFRFSSIVVLAVFCLIACRIGMVRQTQSRMVGSSDTLSLAE